MQAKLKVGGDWMHLVNWGWGGGGVGGWGGGDERAFIFIPLRFLLKRVCSDRKEFALKRFRPNEINLIPPGPPPPPSVVFLLTVPKQFIYYSSSSSVIASLPLYRRRYLFLIASSFCSS